MGLEGKEDWKEGRESRTFSLQRIVKSKQESSLKTRLNMVTATLHPIAPVLTGIYAKTAT